MRRSGHPGRHTGTPVTLVFVSSTHRTQELFVTNHSPCLARRLSLAVAALIAAATCCAVPAHAAPPDKKTLQIAAPWEIGSLDPAKAGYIFTRMQVSETLVGVDAQGGLAPGLASGWEVSANQLVWRFRLRPGAKFHDGAALTPADAVRALERARANPGVLGNAPVQKISADKDAVVFELSRPFSPLAAFLAHASTQILAPASYAADGTVKAVVGTGPYKIASIQPPQKMEVERFDGWQGKKPAIERVGYLAVGRGETRNMLANSGQADLVFTHDPANFDRLKAQKKLKFESMAIPRTIYIKVNAAHPALKDVATRRALSLAIDRTGIATGVMREPRAAATQLFAPVMQEWHVPALQSLGRDLAQARELLKSAGWTPGPGGVLQRDGKPFKVTMRTFSDRPELPTIATAIQAQLKEVGIDMAVAIMNSGEIPGGHKDGSLELALLARNYSLVPDPVGTLLQDFGPTGGDWGAMNWTSAALRDAIAALSGASDANRRSVLRGTIATILQADLPVIPVIWYQHTTTHGARISNVSIDPLELSYRIDQMQWTGRD
jgi:peptide/nickel transport system substrate-binding protein